MDYFAETSDTSPLLHTWSLAVEEHFYLLFPLLLLLLAKCGKLVLLRTIAGLSIASLALSIVGTYLHPLSTFYLLPARAWELLLGALLAISQGHFTPSQLIKDASGWLGFSLLCYAVLFYDGHTRFPGLAAIPPCLGAALIIFSSESGPSALGRILAIKPVVFVGLISYSLYLWHFPLLVFSNYQIVELPAAQYRAALLVASVVLAALSWRFVETPFRKRWLCKRRQQVFAFAGGSMIILLFTGFLVAHRSGFESRFSTKALHYAASRNHRAFLNSISLEDALAGKFVELGTRDTNQPVRVLIWGDSHAMALTPVVDDLCHQYAWRGIQATHNSTAPVLGYVSTGPWSLKHRSPAFSQAVLRFIAQQHVKYVIIAAAWPAYPASDLFKTNLLMTVREVMGAGSRAFVVKDVPDQGFDVARLIALAVQRGDDLEGLGIRREKHGLANRDLQQTFDQIAQMGATVLDPSVYLLNQKAIYGVVQNESVLYFDHSHLTVEGSRLLAPLFEPIFRVE